MQYGKDFGTRFSQSLGLLKKYWKDYILLNLLLIAYWLAFVVIGIGLVIILSFTGKIVAISVSGVIILTLMRLLGSTTFLGNFYLTKSIEEGKTFSIKALANLAYKKLAHKVKVDFWMSLVILYIIAVIGVAFLLFALLGNSIGGIVSVLLGLIVFVFAIVYAVKIGLDYAFSYYYCFDNEDYSWKKFNEAKKLVEGRYWQVFGNWILIAIIVGILSFILNLILNLLLGLFGFNISHTISNINYQYLLLAFYSVGVIIGIVIYFVLRYLINTLLSILSFVYWYIYYKASLKLEDEKVEEKTGL